MRGFAVCALESTNGNAAEEVARGLRFSGVLVASQDVTIEAVVARALHLLCCVLEPFRGLVSRTADDPIAVNV